MWQRRGYTWALVLVMWRGYMFLSTQKFEEEKLGKVERKVEPEKNNGSYKWAFVWELWDGRQLFPLRALRW